MEFIPLDVQRRAQKGTAASRRLRREGRVPAVLYGLGRENADLTVDGEALADLLHGGSKLVELRLGDLKQQAILRDLQFDPLTDAVVHVDLLRVDEHHEIEANVEVEFKGIPKGLTEGGVFEPVLAEVRVRCTPARLPKVIVVDVSGLALNQAVTVKDLPLPAGVAVLHHKPDDHVCHCVVQKVVSLEPAAPAAEGPAEPERIGGKKPEEEPAEEGGKPAGKKEEKKEERKEAKK